MKTLRILIALLFVGIATQVSAQQKELKLISYNVYWGMKQDTTQNKAKFAEWIRQQDPDIIAFQEMNEFSQESADLKELQNKKCSSLKNLERFAESYGHSYAFIVREPFTDGTISFPVAITSKYPIVNVQRVVENCIHGFLVAEIGGHNFIITHLHPFSAAKRTKEVDQILAVVESKPADAKWLFMGDLNSVSPLDKSGYDDNLLRDFIKEDRKKRPQNKNLGPDDELDYSIQQKILNFGFVDAFKVSHPQFESSAPTKMFYDQSKHPLRYDYLYVSKNMKKDIIKCEIIKDDFTDIYSDHYPVMLIFKK